MRCILILILSVRFIEASTFWAVYFLFRFPCRHVIARVRDLTLSHIKEPLLQFNLTASILLHTVSFIHLCNVKFSIFRRILILIRIQIRIQTRNAFKCFHGIATYVYVCINNIFSKATLPLLLDTAIKTESLFHMYTMKKTKSKKISSNLSS